MLFLLRSLPQAAAVADVTRFVKLLIKMYQAGSTQRFLTVLFVTDNVPCQLIS